MSKAIKRTITTTPGLELVKAERIEQIYKHGHTFKKDDKLKEGDLLGLGKYIIFANKEYLPEHFKNDTIYQTFAKTRKQQLIIAASMIIAEIDKIDRLEDLNGLS